MTTSLGDLDLLTATMQADVVRIELSTAYSLAAGVGFPCARLYVKLPNGRWQKAKLPLILPPVDGDRSALLRLLADVAALPESTSDSRDFSADLDVPESLE